MGHNRIQANLGNGHSGGIYVALGAAVSAGNVIISNVAQVRDAGL